MPPLAEAAERANRFTPVRIAEGNLDQAPSWTTRSSRVLPRTPSRAATTMPVSASVGAPIPTTGASAIAIASSS